MLLKTRIMNFALIFTERVFVVSADKSRAAAALNFKNIQVLL